MQDLPRIGDAIAIGEIKKAPALTGLDRRAEKKRRHLPPDRPRLARRRAFAPGPRRGAGQNPRRRRRADRGARHHRRPRYAAAIGRRRPEAIHRGAAEVRAGRDRARPLLRDGPRQALGARGEGLQRHRRSRRPALPRRAGGHRRRLCAKAIRRVHRAGGDRRLSRHQGRRRRAVLQLPRRPGARNSRRHARSGFLRLSAQAHRSSSPPPSAWRNTATISTS